MTLPASLMNYVMQTDIVKKGQAKGYAKGRAEGRDEGRDEGRAEGRAEAVLTVLRARALSVAAEHEERIRACSSNEQLDRWLQRAATASSLDEIFEDSHTQVAT